MMLKISIPIQNQMNVIRDGFPDSRWRFLTFRNRIDIRFVDIVVQNLIVYEIDPISVLYQNISFKIVLF